MPANSSWVTGSTNSLAPLASSSRRLAVRPVTSRNTESARASSIPRSRSASMRTTPHRSSGRRSSSARAGAVTELQHLRRLQRPSLGRPGQAVQHAHLAEQVAVLHERDHALAPVEGLVGDGHPPAQHDVQRVRRVAFVEQHVASHEAAGAGMAGQLGELLGAHPLEELGGREHVFVGHGAGEGTTLARRAWGCVGDRRRRRVRRALRRAQAVRAARSRHRAGPFGGGGPRRRRRRGRGGPARSSGVPHGATEAEPAEVEGGATRSESVRRGLAVVPAEAEIVVVHDAARPFARPSSTPRSSRRSGPAPTAPCLVCPSRHHQDR